MYNILPLITNYKLTNKVSCSILTSVVYINVFSTVEYQCIFLEMVLHLRGYTCVRSTIKIRNGGVCYISFILDFTYNGNMTCQSPNTKHTVCKSN